MKRKKHGFAFLAVAVTALWSVVAGGAPAPEPAAPAWPEETVRDFALLPIQDGGRIKPLETYARFKLLKFNGKTTFKAGDDLRTPTEWLLDCLFYPELAKGYKTFIVDSGEVLDALGVAHDAKRGRYAYRELEPARAKLFELARQHAHKEPRDRSVVEAQLVNLAGNVREFEELLRGLDFARRNYPTEGIAPYGGAAELALSRVLEHARSVSQVLTALQSRGAGQDSAEVQAINKLFHEMDRVLGDADALALFPPPGDPETTPEWLTPSELAALAFADPRPVQEYLPLLASLERMAQAEDPAAAAVEADAFLGGVKQRARARGEYDRIGLEYAYYNFRLGGLAVFYTLVQYLYVVAFLGVAVLWMRPRSRVLGWAVPMLIAVPTLLLAAGITLRCLIRLRPPVTTLYETILFITATAVVVALIMEYMNRQRIALSLAAFLGALGVFLATKYEIKEGADTMPSMVAVLDTNFWLSTHVTTITIGYAAGLLAGALAHVFVFGKLLGLKRGDPEFYRSVTRMVYGVLCFGLLFATVGTVLGGIWANESWGRFWGWDPKENGALMIVLWGLLVLHARLGGYIRDYGVNLAAIVGGMIVAFSWFGVNLLGVGLHSYGFTSGIFTALVAFYAIETVVLFAGFGAWLWEETLRVNYELRIPNYELQGTSDD
jgi:ABC-type transport system involved in cytochrome c biogenesis permease subunit